MTATIPTKAATSPTTISLKVTGLRGVVSKLPCAYKTIQHLDTGHTYNRRTRTDEAQALTVGSFKKMLPKKYEAGFEQRTFYLNDYKHDILAFIETTLEPPGIPVRFEVTQQHKGQRVWFVCPHCYRRVGKLYRVKAKHFLYRAWGCQKCLGLARPSRSCRRLRPASA